MMPRSLVPDHVIGILSPLANVNTQIEFEVLAPPEVLGVYTHFDFGETFTETLKHAARDICTFRPEMTLFSLSPEMNPTVDDPRDYVSRLRELIENRTQLPLITATEATVHALKTVGAKTVGIIAPVPDENSVPVTRYYDGAGIVVNKFVGMAKKIGGMANIRTTPGSLIEEAFASADSPSVDALVHIGTGLPVLGLIEKLERQYQKPVISCNSAMIWNCLRDIGYTDRLDGYGRLFSEY